MHTSIILIKQLFDPPTLDCQGKHIRYFHYLRPDSLPQLVLIPSNPLLFSWTHMAFFFVLNGNKTFHLNNEMGPMLKVQDIKQKES